MIWKGEGPSVNYFYLGFFPQPQVSHIRFHLPVFSLTIQNVL
jgi:hypothetical protein